MTVQAKVSKDDLDAIEYLQKHPEEFPYIVYDKGPDGQPVKLEEWQTECLKALRKKKRISIRAGHGVGKSAYLTFVIHWFMLTHYPCKVPCTANSQSQLFAGASDNSIRSFLWNLVSGTGA